MPDNRQIKDGLGNLFTVRMRDISAAQDGSVQRSMFFTTEYTLDFGVGGVYKNIAYSGIIHGSLPANSVIYSFFWATPGMIAVIPKLKMFAWSDATAFTSSGPCKFETVFGRQYIDPATGGTIVNLASNQNKLRTSMTDARAVIQIAGTGAIMPGTRVLDQHPLETQVLAAPLNPATMFKVEPIVLFDTRRNEHPIVVESNEGIEIIATVPPIGSWMFSMAASWAETETHNY